MFCKQVNFERDHRPVVVPFYVFYECYSIFFLEQALEMDLGWGHLTQNFKLSVLYKSFWWKWSCFQNKLIFKRIKENCFAVILKNTLIFFKTSARNGTEGNHRQAHYTKGGWIIAAGWFTTGGAPVSRTSRFALHCNAHFECAVTSLLGSFSWKDDAPSDRIYIA